jgi:hypothetical protein
MNQGKTILAQLLSFISKYEFDKCVNRYSGNYKVSQFKCWEQFIVMSFAQLTYRESLRDIEACLESVQNKLYHCGLRSRVKKSTLSDANKNRDWRIYADFAQVLVKEARALYKEDNDFNIDIENMAYALDSTTIDLCLSLFPWARFRKAKGAVRMHTLLDLRGNIPTFVDITTGLVHDVNVLDILYFEPGAFYIMDRGYVDYERLFSITRASAYFVVRAKSNFKYHRITSEQIDKATGLRCDQTVKLSGFYARQDYPEKLRRVRYYDQETGRTLVFMTNNFQISALMVAMLYKERWKIELFFKWIKQHLRIKSFFGTSRNAVFTQIWIAVCTYLLVVIVKRKLTVKKSPHIILQILSISLFEKTSLNKALQRLDYDNLDTPNSNQLNIFDL